MIYCGLERMKSFDRCFLALMRCRWEFYIQICLCVLVRLRRIRETITQWPKSPSTLALFNVRLCITQQCKLFSIKRISHARRTVYFSFIHPNCTHQEYIVIAKTSMRFWWAICFALCPDHIYNSHNECSSGLKLLKWAPAIFLDTISTVCIDTSLVDASFNDTVYFDTVAFSLFRQVRGTHLWKIYVMKISLLFGVSFWERAVVGLIGWIGFVKFYNQIRGLRLVTAWIRSENENYTQRLCYQTMKNENNNQFRFILSSARC